MGNYAAVIKIERVTVINQCLLLMDIWMNFNSMTHFIRNVAQRTGSVGDMDTVPVLNLPVVVGCSLVLC